MARTPQDVTEAELGVLQALWDGGPATIRKLTDALGKPVSYVDIPREALVKALLGAGMPGGG